MNTHEHSYRTDMLELRITAVIKQVDFSFSLKLEAMTLKPFTIAELLPELMFDLQGQLGV